MDGTNLNGALSYAFDYRSMVEEAGDMLKEFLDAKPDELGEHEKGGAHYMMKAAEERLRLQLEVVEHVLRSVVPLPSQPQ